MVSGCGLGIVANKHESFVAVCKRLKLPYELTEAYKEWLLSRDKRPGLKFVESQVSLERGKHTTKGTLYPRPEGKLWRHIRDKVAREFKHCPETYKMMKAQEVGVENVAEAFMTAYSAIRSNQESRNIWRESDAAVRRQRCGQDDAQQRFQDEGTCKGLS